MILSLGLPEEEAERGAATLAKKAAGRFIYARFVEEQLRGHTSSLKLAKIGDLPTGLDDMYTSYFERMFANEASRVRKWEEVQPLVEMIAAAPEPLPLAAVAPALALSNKHTMGLAKDVVAFFTLKGTKGKLRFCVYHKSIMDYFCRHEDREHARRRGLAEQGRGAKKGGGTDEKEEEDDEYDPYADDGKDEDRQGEEEDEQGLRIRRAHGHSRLADFALALAAKGGWRFDKSNIGLYALRHMVPHCAGAGRWADLCDTLLNWKYIQAKAEANELGGLNREYAVHGGQLMRRWCSVGAAGGGVGGEEEEEEEMEMGRVQEKWRESREAVRETEKLVKLVGQACAMSTPAMRLGAGWFADQLWNRLAPIVQQHKSPLLNDSTRHRLSMLVQQLDLVRRAIHSGPTMYSVVPQLPPAGTALQQVLKGHDGIVYSVCSFTTVEGAVRIVSGSADKTWRAGGAA
jgi:hypothetical protein